MSEPIQVQEKAPRPQGLLPKHVQSWLLVGLAFLMIAIMWLTGGKKPPAPTKSATGAIAPPAPLEVNETKITELQNRIEDLQRQQLVAQNALAQQSQLLAASPGSVPTQEQPNAATSDPPRTEDPFAGERKNRAYTSLFASNVALSYRPAPAQASIPTPSSASLLLEPDALQVAQLLKQLQPSPGPVAPTPQPQTQTNSTQPEKEGKEEGRNLAVLPEGAHSAREGAAAGKTYILFEGTILETTLINRLEGQFAGPVECLVSTDVYSNDRQHLLIPAGSKLIGETRKVDTFGQTRLAIVFHRLLMPDGYSVSLDQFKGLDQIGSTGLRDEVNNHYLRIFGVSLAIGALGAVAEAGTGTGTVVTEGDLMRQGFAASTAQSSAQILDRFLNIMPTVTIREGYRVKVILSGDLALPDYNNHQMPSNF
jgi:type IV secretory pathway VirB10-like protein